MRRSEMRAFCVSNGEKVKTWIVAKPYYACVASFVMGMLTILVWDMAAVILFLGFVIGAVAWFLAEPDIQVGPPS